MKVLFLKNFKNIAKKGDIKEVNDGYANNYLIPQKIAVFADKNIVNKVKNQEKFKKKKEEKIRKQAFEMAEKLPKLHLQLKVQVDKNKKLYAGIGADILSKELKKLKYNIEPKQILLDHKLKELGTYVIKVRLIDKLESFFNVTLIPINNK